MVFGSDITVMMAPYEIKTLKIADGISETVYITEDKDEKFPINCRM